MLMNNTVLCTLVVIDSAKILTTSVKWISFLLSNAFWHSEAIGLLVCISCSSYFSPPPPTILRFYCCCCWFQTIFSDFSFFPTTFCVVPRAFPTLLSLPIGKLCLWLEQKKSILQRDTQCSPKKDTSVKCKLFNIQKSLAITASKMQLGGAKIFEDLLQEYKQLQVGTLPSSIPLTN